MGNNLNYPFGPVDYQTPAGGSNVALDIVNDYTVVEIDKVTKGPLDISINSKDVPKGAMLRIITKDGGGGNNLTFGNGIVGKDVTVSANGVWGFTFILDDDGDFSEVSRTTAK